MLLDLVMLTVLGCLLEGLATKMSGLVFKAAPSFTFTFLITFIAVMRWNWKGLFIIPLLVGATILGGRYNDLPYLAAIYDWRIYVAGCVALLTLGLNSIFYKKFGTKRVMINIIAVIGLVVLDYALYSIVFKFMYRILCSGNPFVMGSIPFEALHYNADTEEYFTQIDNLCFYVEQTAIYNMFGLVVTFVGIFILRSQGVVNNVVDKLIEDKKAKEEIQNAEKFEIPDALDEEVAENDESKKSSIDSQEN